MIYVIDDDFVMARCVKRAILKTGKQARIFSNTIDAIDYLDSELPEMIFLDILLTGPDGFDFLNEIVSYPDTAGIPIVIVSSIKFLQKELMEYGVVAALEKDKMTPKQIGELVMKYAGKMVRIVDGKLEAE